MRIFVEIFLFLSIMLPIFHMLNAIPKNRKSKLILLENIEEKPITILIPCFNEESILKNTIDGMLRINYNNFNCVFINDGSNDNTLELLIELLEASESSEKYAEKLPTAKVHNIYQSNSHPNFFIINKDNGGKGDSLNAGINFAKDDIVVTLDADCVLKKNALNYMNQAFVPGKTIAASGVIHILQSYKLTKNSACLGLRLPTVLRIQTVEYIKACYTYKASLFKMKALTIISGAFGVFDRNILLELNGYRNTVGEDIDITLRIQFYIQKNEDKEIAYIPEAICYTEGPETWADLIRQRTRWQKAFLDCLVIYKSNIFKSAFTNSLSFFMIFDSFLMGTFSTLLFLFSYILLFAGIFVASFYSIYTYYLLFLCMHFLYNVISLIISKFYNISFNKKDKFHVLITILFDMIVYRFLVIVFIFKGTFGYFFNRKLWDRVKRSGTDYMVLGK